LKRSILILLLLACLAVSVAVAQQAWRMLSFGSVLIPATEIKVYTSAACTQECTYINWGNLQPDTTGSITVYIKNVGARPVTLMLNATEWNPAQAAQQLTLSWDYTGLKVPVEGVLAVTLFLQVSPYSTVEQFSFNIIVTANWSE
jgi:hypothetical protein